MIGWKLKALIGVSLLAVSISALWYIDHLRTELEEAEGDYEKVSRDLEQSESARWQEHASSMRVYFNETQRIQELEDEKARLAERLADDAIGLRVSAECPEPQRTAATGEPDETGPRLTDAARRDYITLRERIVEVRSQVTGLQRYINEECLKNTPD